MSDYSAFIYMCLFSCTSGEAERLLHRDKTGLNRTEKSFRILNETIATNCWTTAVGPHFISKR